jgi:hypothetical protein
MKCPCFMVKSTWIPQFARRAVLQVGLHRLEPGKFAMALLRQKIPTEFMGKIPLTNLTMENSRNHSETRVHGNSKLHQDFNWKRTEKSTHLQISWQLQKVFTMDFLHVPLHQRITVRSMVTIWGTSEVCRGLETSRLMEVFPWRGGSPIAGWLISWKIMENPIKMDDLGLPSFLDTSICLDDVDKTY